MSISVQSVKKVLKISMALGLSYGAGFYAGKKVEAQPWFKQPVLPKTKVDPDNTAAPVLTTVTNFATAPNLAKELATLQALYESEKASHTQDKLRDSKELAVLQADLGRVKADLVQANVPCIGKQLGKTCMETDLGLSGPKVTNKRGVLLAAWALADLRNKMVEERDTTLRAFARSVMELSDKEVEEAQLSDIYPVNKFASPKK